MTAPVSLSFIIPVRNDADGLRRCLRGVLASAAGQAHEIIVVDNGSTDESADVAREAGARVISAPGVRVSAVRNKGAHSAQGVFLAFVDADNEICAAWARAATEAFSGDDVAAVGAPSRAPRPGTWVQRAFDAMRQHPVNVEDAEWLGAANLVVRKAAFVAVGGFDETLETCEDVDFCRRIKGAGLRLLANARLESIHHGDPPTLSAVFRGEWWRGRDNLRVSLRAPRSWRSLLSFSLSGSLVVALLAMIAGLLAGSTGTGAVSVAASLIVVVLVVRATRIVSGLGSRRPVVLGQALAVAAAYEAGRAMALVSRTSHARRQARPR